MWLMSENIKNITAQKSWKPKMPQSAVYGDLVLKKS